MRNQILYKRLSFILLIVGPLASLAVSPISNYDPINLVKLMFVVPIGFCSIFLIGTEWKHFHPKLSKFFWIASSIFTFAMISTLIFSGAPLNQQIWGCFGRNTGFLTYFSLLGIAISTALIQKPDFYRSITHSLLITAVPVTIYCLIQMTGNDPVGWSSLATFATFGNVNFLSAFLGLSSLAGFISILDKRIDKFLRVGIFAMSLLAIRIMSSTGSIQGVMILAAGLGISFFLLIRSIKKVNFLQIPYILISIVSFISVLIGLLNKGPLAKYIYSETVTYRGDYAHAGWVMTIKHPFFGVGLDSYGDWYRKYRGLISTMRTTPDRISNTAHNIFLDISSNGGFPLIIAYLIILAFALRASLKFIRRTKTFDPTFAILFSCWVAYQLQSAISINQIGVGIWGWLLTGSLIGFEICTRETVNGTNENRAVKSSRKGRRTNSTLSASTGVIGFLGLFLGFVLAFIPMYADAKFKSALITRNLINISKSTEILGSTSWHLNVVLDAALKANAADAAKSLDERLISEYPNDFFGWRVRYGLLSSTPDQRKFAIGKALELDPFNPQTPKS